MPTSFMHCAKVGLILATLLAGSVARADDSESPLMAAAATGDVARVKALLSQGADVSATDEKFGSSALGWAALEGHKEIVELLLANKADVNGRNGSGGTPLFGAVVNGHTEVVEVLVAHGANVNATGYSGGTPLETAAWKGHKGIVEVLLVHGADVNARNNDGETPLYTAVLAGHKEIVELLLANKADANIPTKGRGVLPEDTALCLAAFDGNREIVELLLGHDADPNAKRTDGETPVDAAELGGHEEIVELLVANRADVNAADKDGQTPLEWAIDKGNKELVEFLLTHHADVNLRDNDGWTPLHEAAYKGYKEIVEVLLAHHADVNATGTDDFGETPLDTASSAGRKEIAEVLLAHGADVNAADNKGRTPLDLAALRGHKDIVELLLAHHADVNVKTTNGVSALALAEFKGHNDIVKLLLPTTITVDGIIYSNVTFGTVTPTTVSVFHKTGVAGVPLEELPPELQEYFGYDPQKAADYRMAVADADQRTVQRHAEVQREPAGQPSQTSPSRGESRATSLDGCITATDPSGRVVSGPDVGGIIMMSAKATAVNSCDHEKRVFISMQGVDKDGYGIIWGITAGSVPANSAATLSGPVVAKPGQPESIVSWQVTLVLDGD